MRGFMRQSFGGGDPPAPTAIPREGYAPVENVQLYYRDLGQGRPIIATHRFLPTVDHP
jgi:hypothetical protein